MSSRVLEELWAGEASAPERGVHELGVRDDAFVPIVRGGAPAGVNELATVGPRRLPGDAVARRRPDVAACCQERRDQWAD